jgi:hypothetical protein
MKKLLGQIGFLSFALLLSAVMPQISLAQYFVSGETKVEIISAGKNDSVIFAKRTAFQVPEVKEEDFALVYHEPAPDSLMPRSAIVLGDLTIQAETAQDIVDELEEFAEEHGANWIVGFAEPRLIKTKDGKRYYRSSAQLLRVLDDRLIDQKDLVYHTVESEGMPSYAAVIQWFDTYGKHLGEQIEKEEEVEIEVEE